MELVGGILDLILLLCIILLIARFVLDWVQMLARHWRPRGLVLVFCEGLYSITDPPLRAVRRVIPPLRLGAVRSGVEQELFRRAQRPAGRRKIVVEPLTA